MMNPGTPSIGILALLGFILQLWLTPAFAVNPCALSKLDGLSEGIGGTGKKPVSQEGLGGTGRSDWQDGIGGTGHSEGLGGTGMPMVSGNVTVVGVVTGFASVCVNGLEIHYDQSTRIAVDGKLSDTTVLRLGQVVMVEATQLQGRLSAIAMNVRHEMVGKVSAIDRINGVAEIMGRRLKISEQVAGLDLSKLSRGDLVSVSGLRGPQDEIIVTRLEQQNQAVQPYERRGGAGELAAGLASVQGIVEKANNEGIRLVDWPNIVLDTKSSDREMDVESGDLVHVVIDNREGRPGIIDFDLLEREDLYERAGYEVIDYEKPVEKEDSYEDKGEVELEQLEENEQTDEQEYESSELPEEEYEAPEYESPEVEEYETPEFESAEVEEYEAPELPEAPEYEAPELPEVPEYEAPELPEVPEYEAPELPEVPEYEAPELPEVPEYETPELPEAPEYEAPELPEAPEYEAPELPEAPEHD